MKQVFKGTLVLSLMSIVTQLGSMLLLPIYSHVIAPDMYGVIGLLTPFSTLALIIFGLGFATTEARDLVDLDKDPEELGSYLFTVNLFLLGFSIVGFAVLLFQPTQNLIISALGFTNIPFHFIVLSYVSAILSNFVLMVNTYLNFEQKYVRRAISTTIAFIVSNTFALYIIFSTGDGVMGKLLGGIIAQLVIAVILGLGYVRQFKLRFNLRFVRSSLSFGIPMTITGLFLTMSDNGNRFIMNQFLPLDLVGQFTIAWTIVAPVSIVFTSFHVVWMPVFFKSLHDGQRQREIENRLLSVLLIVTCAIFLAQLFISDLARLILSDQYRDGATLSVSLLPYFLALALSTLLGDYLIYFRKTHLTTLIYVGVGSASLAANYLLIPRFGVEASILLMTFSQLLVSLVFFITLYVKFKVRFRYWIYALTMLMVFNPLAILVGEQSFAHRSGLVMKAIYGLMTFGVLLWLFPNKGYWFKRSKQLMERLLTRNRKNLVELTQ